MKILLDVSRTSQTSALTGIQRVTRCIYEALSKKVQVIPVCLDNTSKCWRQLSIEELNRLDAEKITNPSSNRKSQVSFYSKFKNYFLTNTKAKNQEKLFFQLLQNEAVDAILLPELYNPELFEHYKRLKHTLNKPIFAIFHDAIAMKWPEFTPKKTVQRYPLYLKTLQEMDGVIANSACSKEELNKYWDFLGFPTKTQLTHIDLATHFKGNSQNNFSVFSEANLSTILCVGTLEGRKNQINLLKAAQKLWDSNLKFKLVIVGAINKETGYLAKDKINELINQNYPIEYHSAVSDQKLNELYNSCTFTVYPSIYEGFGLPVVESLWFGKPCICGKGGALRDVGQMNGCYQVDEPTTENLATAIKDLLNNPNLLASLTQQTQNNHFKTWDEYVDELLKMLPLLKN